MHATDGVAAAPAQPPVETGIPLAASEQRLQRLLKFIVVALAILLFAGLAAVLWRVIYLASPATTQPAAPTRAVRPELSLALPAGAEVRSISLSGSRLAVHYGVGAAAGIAVLDLETGRTVTNVAVEARQPAD